MEEPVTVQCPFCGESFVTFFDASVGGQTYIEDCQVCCRPISMTFKIKKNGEIVCSTDRS